MKFNQINKKEFQQLQTLQLTNSLTDEQISKLASDSITKAFEL